MDVVPAATPAHAGWAGGRSGGALCEGRCLWGDGRSGREHEADAPAERLLDLVEEEHVPERVAKPHAHAPRLVRLLGGTLTRSARHVTPQHPPQMERRPPSGQQSGGFCGSFLREAEVSAYVGRNQNLKDLTAVLAGVAYLGDAEDILEHTAYVLVSFLDTPIV